MKYQQIIHTLPRLLTSAEATDYVAGPTMLALFVADFGLKPVTQRKGLTVYDRTELDICVEKLKQSNRKKAA